MPVQDPLAPAAHLACWVKQHPSTGQLSKELEDLVLFHRIVTQFRISDAPFRALQSFLKRLGVELPSKFRLDRLAARLSAVKVQKVDMCGRQCCLFAGPNKHAVHCPSCGCNRWKDMVQRKNPVATTDVRDIASFAAMLHKVEEHVLGGLRETDLIFVIEFTWPWLDVGPMKPSDWESILAPVVEQAVAGAKGQKTFVHAHGREEEVRSWIVLVNADTVEEVMLMGTVGATSRISCLWCDFPGWKKPGTRTYHPVHSAPIGDPDRGDCSLISVDPRTPGPPIDVSWKHKETLEEALEVINNPLTANIVRNASQLKTGISRRPPLFKLPLFPDLFAFNFTLESLHLDYQNITKDVINRLCGAARPACGKQLNTAILTAMSAAQEASPLFIPIGVAEHLPPIKEKVRTYKGDQRRTLIGISIPPSLFGITFAVPEVADVLVVLSKYTSLKERTRFSLTLPNEGTLVDLTTLPDDGIPVASVATINGLRREFVRLYELVCYARDPEFTKATSTWGLENYAGASARKVKGKHLLAAELKNNHTCQARQLGVELRFGLRPLIPSSTPSPPHSAKHPQLPQSLFFTPSKLNYLPSDHEAALLHTFAASQGDGIAWMELHQSRIHSEDSGKTHLNLCQAIATKGSFYNFNDLAEEGEQEEDSPGMGDYQQEEEVEEEEYGEQ
ncbi:hypothetical protein JCM1840_001747 [Sporobolomyces johnsonii]